MMGVLQFPTPIPMTNGDFPNLKFAVFSDDLATVTTAGYLNQSSITSGTPLSSADIIMALYSFDQQTQTGTFGIFTVSISASNGRITLTQWSTGGGGAGVVLPTVANYIAHFTDSAGTISSNADDVVNPGNITAGTVLGVSGFLRSYPTSSNSGSLVLEAVDNSSGNFNTTISNDPGILQSQTISVPDVGSSSGLFILSDSANGQAIAGDLQITDGLLVVGKNDDSGQANSLITIESQTASKGSFNILMTDNIGNFPTVITNEAQNQLTLYVIPNTSNGSARFLVAASSSPFINGNLPKASGTGGLMVDSGISAASLTTLLSTNFYTTVDVTVSAADLTSSGSVFVAPADSNSYILRNVIVNVSTGLSGGGGDRTIIITNGDGILAQIGAPLVQAPVNTLWGGTDLSVAAGIPINDVAAPGSGIYITYFGGTTDYTTGSINITVSYTKA